MDIIHERTKQTDWDSIYSSLHQRGHALINNWLNEQEANDLKDLYDLPDTSFRKTVDMQRYRFGKGEYKYFKYPLPSMVAAIRGSIYPKLALLANSWAKVLGMERQFPVIHENLLQLCHNAGQLQPTPLILTYRTGGYNTLHQDLYGDIYFPFQVVLFLSDPGADKDYEGGEFILMEQMPRAQSKATVLQPKKGDMLIFTTQYRPVLRSGNSGHYSRVSVKHGVSEIKSGNRYTLGIIFHDAVS